MPLIVRTKEDLIRKKKYQVTHALKSAKMTVLHEPIYEH